MGKVKDELNVTVNYANSGDNAKNIEQNNIIVKEIYYAQYHILPFHNILKVMIYIFGF